MESPTELEKNILRTLCWFSLFAYPLTIFEIWKWMLQEEERWKNENHSGDKNDEKKQWKLEEVLRIVENSPFLKERLEEKNGFFCVKKYGSISDQIKKRHEGFLDAGRKLKKIRRVLWWFRLFPQVEAVAACNSLGWFSTNRQSDMDLFIVVKPGSIWTTRLFLVFPFMVLGKRPGQKKEDPFCFSFFVTSDALCFEPFLLPNGDPYFAYWTLSLFPLFDRKDIFPFFFQKNSWTQNYLPQAFGRQGNRTFCCVLPTEKNIFQKRSRSFLESFAKRLQMWRLPVSLRRLVNQDSRVIMTDHVLKFHENDRRAQYGETWRRRCEEVL